MEIESRLKQLAKKTMWIFLAVVIFLGYIPIWFLRILTLPKPDSLTNNLTRLVNYWRQMWIIILSHQTSYYLHGQSQSVSLHLFFRTFLKELSIFLYSLLIALIEATVKFLRCCYTPLIWIILKWWLVSLVVVLVLLTLLSSR